MLTGFIVPLSSALHLVPSISLQSSRLPIVLRSSAPLLSASEEEISWQEELEKVLSPGTGQADREVLLKDLLARGPEIAKEISDKASSGDLADLVPDDSQSGQILQGMTSVQRQVVEDILPQAAAEAQSLLDPSKLQEAVQRAAIDAQEAQSTAPIAASAVASLLQDPARVFNLVQQETRNAFSRTPEGLETPSFTVISSGQQYEVRAYPSYGVAVTSIGSADAAADAIATARGFNSLATFFFGANADTEVMDMTAPLRVDVSPTGAEMALPLPAKYSAATSPVAQDGKVTLRQTMAETIAVREFTGFATGGEIKRQLSSLLDQLQRDAVSIRDGDTYAVLQYNPPYTLPWLRRNEIAVPIAVAVAASDDVAAADAAAEAAAVAAAVADFAAEAAASDSGIDVEPPSDVDDNEFVAEASEPSDDVEPPSDVDEESPAEMEAEVEMEADTSSMAGDGDEEDDLAPSD